MKGFSIITEFGNIFSCSRSKGSIFCKIQRIYRIFLAGGAGAASFLLFLDRGK